MKRNPGVWRPGIRTAPRFPKQAVQAAQEVETAAQRPIRAREQSATRARPSCPRRSPWSRNQAGPGQHRAATRAGFRPGGPAVPHAPCGKPGIPLRGAPTSRSSRDRRLPGGSSDPRPPGAAWVRWTLSSPSLVEPACRAQRSAPPRPALPRSAGHTQARAAQPPTLRRVGAKGAGAERGFCFLFSLWFPARRRKTFIPGQFRFLVGVAPGRRRILLSSAPIVCPVSFLVPHKPQFARGQDRRTDLEDPKVSLRFNVLEF